MNKITDVRKKGRTANRYHSKAFCDETKRHLHDHKQKNNKPTDGKREKKLNRKGRNTK